MNDELVNAKAVLDEERRLEFLPKYVGDRFIIFENYVYSVMDRSSVDYNGGFWKFFELSNGGFHRPHSTGGAVDLPVRHRYI